MCKITDASADKRSNDKTPQDVLYPAITWDYVLKQGPCGIGVFANRNIRKGELVFGDSFEFMFADVQDGDRLRLERHDKASSKSKTSIPSHFPLTREILTRTHGVPILTEDPTGNTAGTITWRLEVPGMLINHSCNPNVIDDSHDQARGEAYAARNIKKGEELFYDYCFQYYDYGPFFDCLCGAENCRGKMMGFKAVTPEQKKQLLPMVSGAVKAMYEADMGVGKPVIQSQDNYPLRKIAASDTVTSNKDPEALRLVCPGPSHAAAPIAVVYNEETGLYQLIAQKDFDFGECVYEYWTQPWPLEGRSPIDMVFSCHLMDGDPPEGAVARVDAVTSGAPRDRQGIPVFSGWDLFTQHSCDPNLVKYSSRAEDEEDDWRGAYATRAINKGEVLTVDLNTLLWDRNDELAEDLSVSIGDGVCTCGASNCRGTVLGYKHLSKNDQEELKSMSWRRVLPPHTEEPDRVYPGEALAPYVRECLRKNATDDEESLESASSCSSSSSEEEWSSSDDEGDEEKKSESY